MGGVSGATGRPLVGELGVCALFGVAVVLVGLALGRSRARAQVA